MNPLTEDEKLAKDYFTVLFGEAEALPCDINLTNFRTELPIWYDAVAYKRGRQYFAANRAGILKSNLVGTIGVLAQHHVLQVLATNGRVSAVEITKRRLVSTLLHMLTWYETELYPRSKSWKSLKRVRKIITKFVQDRERFFISQAELSITQFGFMGLALIRPHIFGIHHKKQDDQQAFVHFWAVLGSILGIQDKYNICLLPFEIVKLVCQLILRYILIPALQLECSEFKAIVKLKLEAISHFAVMTNYDTWLFFARYSVGIPGYQYKANLEKEIHCRSIFTAEEMKHFSKKMSQKLGYEHFEFILFSDIPVFNIIKHSKTYDIDGNEIIYTDDEVKNEIIVNGESSAMDPEYAERLRKYLDIDEKDSISLRLVNYETEWRFTLNDSKYYELNWAAQRELNHRLIAMHFYTYRLGRYIIELIFSIILSRMRRYLANTRW